MGVEPIKYNIFIGISIVHSFCNKQPKNLFPAKYITDNKKSL